MQGPVYTCPCCGWRRGHISSCLIGSVVLVIQCFISSHQLKVFVLVDILLLAHSPVGDFK